MTLLQTPLCQFGFKAPPFQLKNTDGVTLSLDAIKGNNGTLVMFICNHCPYVQRIIAPLVEQTLILKEQHHIGVVAIMPNDTETYPEDSYEQMITFARVNRFHFPYLIDTTQAIAKTYGALCTPDFFGFDKDLGLQYRGRFTTPSPHSDTNDSHELFHAMVAIAEGKGGPSKQFPSMGCSIKWKNEN